MSKIANNRKGLKGSIIGKNKGDIIGIVIQKNGIIRATKQARKSKKSK